MSPPRFVFQSLMNGREFVTGGIETEEATGEFVCFRWRYDFEAFRNNVGIIFLYREKDLLKKTRLRNDRDFCNQMDQNILQN